jgi:hypothetical protein
MADRSVISVAVAPKKMHAEMQETNAPPSGRPVRRRSLRNRYRGNRSLKEKNHA